MLTTIRGTAEHEELDAKAHAAGLGEEVLALRALVARTAAELDDSQGQLRAAEGNLREARGAEESLERAVRTRTSREETLERAVQTELDEAGAVSAIATPPRTPRQSPSPRLPLTPYTPFLLPTDPGIVTQIRIMDAFNTILPHVTELRAALAQGSERTQTELRAAFANAGGSDLIGPIDEQVEQLKAEIKAARDETAGAKAELDDAVRQLDDARRQVSELEQSSGGRSRPSCAQLRVFLREQLPADEAGLSGEVLRIYKMYRRAEAAGGEEMVSEGSDTSTVRKQDRLVRSDALLCAWWAAVCGGHVCTELTCPCPHCFFAWRQPYRHRATFFARVQEALSGSRA
jgi:predicted  nucleic acid-binding Zn-ribbon protein